MIRLKDFNFNAIDVYPVTGLAIIDGDQKYENGGITETLKILPPHLAEAKIKDVRWYFNTFVIELKERKAINMEVVK